MGAVISKEIKRFPCKNCTLTPSGFEPNSINFIIEGVRRNDDDILKEMAMQRLLTSYGFSIIEDLIPGINLPVIDLLFRNYALVDIEYYNGKKTTIKINYDSKTKGGQPFGLEFVTRGGVVETIPERASDV